MGLSEDNQQYFDVLVRRHLTTEWQWLRDLEKAGMRRSGRILLEWAERVGIIERRMRRVERQVSHGIAADVQYQYRLRDDA